MLGVEIMKKKIDKLKKRYILHCFLSIKNLELTYTNEYVIVIQTNHYLAFKYCIKEGTCCDEHWVLYATNESLNTTSKTNDVLYKG